MTIEITPETLFHVLTHFVRIDECTYRILLRAGYTRDEIKEQMSQIGAKFTPGFALSPFEVLNRLQNGFPESFREIAWLQDGRAELSFHTPHPLGRSNIVSLHELSERERASVRHEERNGHSIRTILLEQPQPLTCECQVILFNPERPRLVTLFPGPWAPALPPDGVSSEFWDNHFFVRTK